MGLTTWKDAPKGKIQKFDVSVAKNYLIERARSFLEAATAFRRLAKVYGQQGIDQRNAPVNINISADKL